MSCVKPIEAFRGANGTVVFNRARSLSKVGFHVPCGQCIGCRLERARQWGLRCLHEAKCWPHNSFVTLTYSDEFLPEFGSLSLRDVQLFMKRLRKRKRASRSNPIRFFLGGEYGEHTLRPHYHAVLFNCAFADKRVLSKKGDGECLYTSSELSDCWSIDGKEIGHCTVGDVTMRSAQYCAKYALKKVTGELAEDHYTVHDADGVCYVRRPEFAVMSRRPGIGSDYFARFGNEYIVHDNVVVEGKEVRGTRFYDGRAEVFMGADHSDDVLLCFCDVCVNKRLRKREALARAGDNTADRLLVKEKLMIAHLERKARRL